MTNPTLVENRRKLENKVPESWVTLLKVLPLQTNYEALQGEIFSIFRNHG